MSTKTTFKRIALVAVAALGLGVLSVAPSSAAVSGVTVTVANGTSTNSADGYVSDSTTAATISVSALADSGTESVTVVAIAKSAAAVAATNAFMYYVDSSTSGLTLIDSNTSTMSATVAAAGASFARPVLSADDTTTGVVPSNGFRLSRTTAGYMGAKFAIQLDSFSARLAGTYTWTGVNAAGCDSVVTLNLSILSNSSTHFSTTFISSL